MPSSMEGQMGKRSLKSPFNVKALGSSYTVEIIGGVLGWMSIAELMGFYASILVKDAETEARPTQVMFLVVCGLSSITMGIFGNLPFIVAPGTVHASIHRYTDFEIGGFLASQFVANGMAAVLLWAASHKDMLKVVPSSLRAGYGCGISALVAVLGFRAMGVLSSDQFALNPFTWQQSMAAITIIIALSSISAKSKWVAAIGIPLITTNLIYAGDDRSKFSGYATHGNPLANMNKGTLTSIDFGALGDVKYWPYIFGATLGLFINTLAALLILIDATCLKNVRQTLSDMKGADYASLIGSTSKFRTMALITLGGNMIGNLVGVTSQSVFVQSMISIFAGAKTGLSAVTAGVLFLLTALLWPAMPFIVPQHIQGALGVLTALFFFTIIPTLDLKKGPDMLQLGVPLLLIPLTFQSVNSVCIGAVLGYCAGQFGHLMLRMKKKKIGLQLDDLERSTTKQMGAGSTYSMANEGSVKSCKSPKSRKSTASSLEGSEIGHPMAFVCALQLLLKVLQDVGVWSG
ncbi:unnamed protein product [Chrysoparadoxa australica]